MNRIIRLACAAFAILGGAELYAQMQLPPGTVGAEYLFNPNSVGVNIVFTNGNAVLPYTACTVDSGAIPPGFTFGLTPSNGSTYCQLNGTPTQAGNYSFTLTVTDSAGASTTPTLWMLTINPPITISTSFLPSVPLGSAYPSTTLMATGGTAPYSWSVVSGFLPPGLNLDPNTGIISGTPTAAGTYPVTVQEQDEQLAFGQAQLSIVVIGPLTITGPSSLPVGTVGTVYGPVTFMASGGPGQYSWSATGLPSGLTFSTAGVLSGTPAAGSQGSYSPQFTVNGFALERTQPTGTRVSLHGNRPHDTSNNTASVILPLTISGGLMISSPTSLPNATEGVTYPPVSFTAAGGTGSYTWSASNLPTGMSISPNGVLSGTPGIGTHGRYTVNVIVNDNGNNTSTSTSLLLTVNPANLAITSPNSLAAGTEGVPYPPVTFTATGGAGTWSATGLPNGLGLSGGGVLSGTPGGGTHGNYTVIVTVTDSSGNSASGSFLLTINPSPATGVTLSAASLSFSYIQRNAAPASQSFGVLGSGGTASYSVAASTSSGGNWLAASPASGQTPGNVIVSLQNLASLSPGSYQGTVTVQPQNSSIPAQTVTVSLQVTGAQPQMSLSTTDLRFQVTAGSPAVNGSVRVLNTGGGAINYSATAGTAAWLTITCGAIGTATSSTSGLICLQVNPAGVAAGTYFDSLTVTGAGQQILVSVTLQVSSAATSIVLSATAMTFTAVSGEAGASLASQTVAVLNGGQGTMNWSAQITSDSPWLTISPASGSSEAFGASQPAITFTANPSDPSVIAAGNYYASINVTVPDGSASNSPSAITVLLKILPAGSQVPPTVSTSGLLFTAPEGGAITAAQPLNLINGAAGDVNFNCLLFTAPAANGAPVPSQGWLSGPPATGSVLGSSSFQMSVQVNPGSLPTGIYYSQLRIGFSNGTLENVDVGFLVTAPAGATAAEQRNAPARPADAGSCSQYGTTFVQPVPTDGGTVIAGQSYKLQVQSLCVPNPPSALNLEIDFNDGTVPLVPLYDSVSSTYEATWTPSGAGTVQFQAQSNPTNAVGLPVGATETTPFSVTVGAPDPNGSAIVEGVRNSASYVTADEVAAGSFISIFGKQLAAKPSLISTPPYPTTLAGIQATLGGVALPLYFANADQVNAIVPFLNDQSLNTALELVVRRGKTTAAPRNLNLVKFQPGIFSENQSGSGQGAIQNGSHGYEFADSSHPAKPGDTIVIYGSGLGPVTNPPKPNTPASAGSLTTSQPHVYIDGIKAQVTYSGLSPGSVQLYQVNAVVPKGIHSGTINVYLTINDVQSNTVTIN